MMVGASRRLAGRSNTASALVAGMLRSTLCRPISTAFREERDTFGPIMVPADKFVSLMPTYSYFLVYFVSLDRFLDVFRVTGSDACFAVSNEFLSFYDFF